MPDLLSLSFRVLGVATKPARFAVGKLLGLVRDDDTTIGKTAPPTPEPRFEKQPAPEPPQPRPAAKPRAPSPKAARRAARHEPTKGEAATIRAQKREEEWGDANGPGANVIIDPAVTELLDKP